ncbi:MAG: DUF3419 family protein [Bacteroidales bacterium]|nr:DUF3419 family protein [Bacteroidales bacterium]
MENSQHPNIRYSQSWEDAELLLKALEVTRADHVLSITSGGCNTLSLLAQEPEELVAVDINPAQNYLFELKLAAARILSAEAVPGFLGAVPCQTRLAYLEQLKDEISPEARKYWLAEKVLLEKGVIHCGRFEKYLQVFRRYLLPLIHSRKTVRELLRIKSPDKQKYFYDRVWDSKRWRGMFHVFFSKAVMKKIGRSPAMFRYAENGNISRHYLQKTAVALSRTPVFQNPYLNYILLGSYGQDKPHYLRDEVLSAIRGSATRLKIETQDLILFLKAQADDSFSKFNLSDVFEPLSDVQSGMAFQEIVRTGKTGARVIFWNNLVIRDVPAELRTNFREETQLREQLLGEEKIFFYNDLKIYTLLK